MYTMNKHLLEKKSNKSNKQKQTTATTTTTTNMYAQRRIKVPNISSLNYTENIGENKLVK